MPQVDCIIQGSISFPLRFNSTRLRFDAKRHNAGDNPPARAAFYQTREDDDESHAIAGRVERLVMLERTRSAAPNTS